MKLLYLWKTPFNVLISIVYFQIFRITWELRQAAPLPSMSSSALWTTCFDYRYLWYLFFFILVPLPPVCSLVSICMGYTHINILCHHLFSLADLESCHGGNRPSRTDLLLCGTFMFLLGAPTPFPGQGVSCQLDITGKISKSSFQRYMLLRFLRPPQLTANTTKVHWLHNFLVSFHPSLLFHQYCLSSETDVDCIVTVYYLKP